MKRFSPGKRRHLLHALFMERHAAQLGRALVPFELRCALALFDAMRWPKKTVRA